MSPEWSIFSTSLSMPKEASIYVIPMAAIIPVDDTSYLVIVATLEGFLSVLVAAVPVSYALISIGTATDGSLMYPAGRASSIQLSNPQLVSQGGIIPMSRYLDSAESMARS
ncbi:predicted protein [Histoplasma capsulatum G186AR]|uniref:Uncharacterized protein n=1 Tax=Ajellomyces capsulatus (strain G186AR / H82 / ATCC MYA-2454 / RMSCC 2432) TaxID=447093 RepID=C0NYA1_AJECG|nr:uncharacterized protein HCBG_07895 [Histoplasma capsulatum G186AR]EEH03769.1 predicted protein [Histoplasma capsulatum G186AR]